MTLEKPPRHLFLDCPACGEEEARHQVLKGRVKGRGEGFTLDALVKCDACGAQRSIQKRKSRSGSVNQVATLEEGKTYEFKIESIGKKGDGIAKMDKFTIFIGGVKSGDVVKAKINKIDGNLVFASRVIQ